MSRILICVLLGVGGLLGAAFIFGQKPIEEPIYCQIVDRITDKYIKEYAKPKGLHLGGYGGGFMDDVKRISMDFVSYERLTIEGARRLYVGVIEEYLKRINSNEEVRPYLHNYPFTIDNMKVKIRFEDPKSFKRIGDGHVSFMSVTPKHILYYCAFDLEKDEFIDLYEESYEEALKIIEEENTREKETTSSTST